MPRLFRRNPNLERDLLADRDYRAALTSVGQRVAENANRIAQSAGAPWMARDRARTVQVHPTDDGVRVVNTDHAGHLMEWGGRNNPAHAPLRRGARAAGLDITEQ